MMVDNAIMELLSIFDGNLSLLTSNIKMIKRFYLSTSLGNYKQLRLSIENIGCFSDSWAAMR